MHSMNVFGILSLSGCTVWNLFGLFDQELYLHRNPLPSSTSVWDCLVDSEFYHLPCSHLVRRSLPLLYKMEAPQAGPSSVPSFH